MARSVLSSDTLPKAGRVNEGERHGRFFYSRFSRERSRAYVSSILPSACSLFPLLPFIRFIPSRSAKDAGTNASRLMRLVIALAFVIREFLLVRFCSLPRMAGARGRGIGLSTSGRGKYVRILCLHIRLDSS